MHYLILSSAHDVPVSTTVLFGLLLFGLVTCLALEEKIHAKKSIIAGSFALVALFLGTAFDILPFERIVVGSRLLIQHGEFTATVESENDQHVPVTLPSVDDASELQHAEDEDELVHLHGHRIEMPVYVPGVDWAVIAILLGSSLFVDVTSKSGIFTWIAILVTKMSRGDPLKLLYFYGVMTVVFSAVLNNVTAMIIVGSLTAVSLKKLERNDKLLSFLVIEGLLTNIGGLLTLISSVPNIIVGTSANIDFLTFFIKSGPYVAVATLITIAFGAWQFTIERIRDPEAQQIAAKKVSGFDENDGIESVAFFRFSACMLIAFVITIATTSVLPWISDLQMGFVAMSFAAVMLLRYRSEVDQFYKNLDWDLLGFFVALFVFIYVIEHALVLHAIGSAMAWLLDVGGASGGPTLLLLTSAVFSSVTDNIPLAAMLAKVLGGMGIPSDSSLWWSVIFGANLGGNLTPIGSASTLVAVTLMHRYELPMSFFGFVKIAFPFAVLQLVLAAGYLMFV